MTHSLLLVLHIAVFGYWLGADLVINSEYRFVVHRSDLPVAARNALMDHVMEVDQHVRYALVLQVALGVMLLAGLGIVPVWAGWGALPAGAAWLALVEATHRARAMERGARLAQFDRLLRYGVAALLVMLALTMTGWPGWLRIKLALFAGVIGCGVLIRFQLIRHFAVWSTVVSEGSTPVREGQVRRIYRTATGILVVLWSQIVAIAVLAMFKPA